MQEIPLNEGGRIEEVGGGTPDRVESQEFNAFEAGPRELMDEIFDQLGSVIDFEQLEGALDEVIAELGEIFGEFEGLVNGEARNPDIPTQYAEINGVRVAFIRVDSSELADVDPEHINGDSLIIGRDSDNDEMVTWSEIVDFRTENPDVGEVYRRLRVDYVADARDRIHGELENRQTLRRSESAGRSPRSPEEAEPLRNLTDISDYLTIGAVPGLWKDENRDAHVEPTAAVEGISNLHSEGFRVIFSLDHRNDMVDAVNRFNEENGFDNDNPDRMRICNSDEGISTSRLYSNRGILIEAYREIRNGNHIFSHCTNGRHRAALFALMVWGLMNPRNTYEQALSATGITEEQMQEWGGDHGLTAREFFADEVFQNQIRNAVN